MRFKKQPKEYLRTKQGFLFLPKTIKDETRWLEFAKWYQIHITWECGYMDSDWIE
jgi:hypothetical protein